jgi:hypothetical protein
MGHADIKSFTTKITASGTDTQIVYAPWRTGRRYFVKKMSITNESTSTLSILKLYDKDLSNATPPIRGDSSNNPLLEYIIPQSTTLVIDDKEMINEYFASGIVGNSSVANIVVMVQVEED